MDPTVKKCALQFSIGLGTIISNRPPLAVEELNLQKSTD